MQVLLKSASHRIPILWSLYRPLLRLTSSNLQLQNHIKRSFRRSQNLVGLARVQERMRIGYQMRDELFRLATQPTPSLMAKFASYSTHLASIHDHRPLPLPPPPTPPKPRLTPGIIFSTPYNPPLPRYKPQPPHITMLLFRRRSAIQRRWDRSAILKERIEEAREERLFLRGAGVGEKLISEQWDGTVERAMMKDLHRSFQTEKLRNEMTASPNLIKGAHRANKQREIYRRRKSEERKSLPSV